MEWYIWLLLMIGIVLFAIGIYFGLFAAASNRDLKD